MGVLGLWNLLEPVGKPVPIESLENKVLAIDISIWLNQSVKGYRDRTGNAVPHAHLLGLYQRLCKLLFYRIKPVFVFDGQPPQLKRDTLNRRRILKSKEGKKAKAASAKILDNYLRSQAISQKLQRESHAVAKLSKQGAEGIHNLLSRRTAEREKDLFELPEIPQESVEIISSDSDSEAETILQNLGVDTSDIYNLDVNSARFKSLPETLQYDVLSEMKQKRKQNSWATMHQMPKKLGSFSNFQLERLRHRRGIQKTLDTVKDSLHIDPAETLGAELFVGDASGLRTVKKEMRTNSGSTILYASGLNEARRQQAIEAERRKREKQREAALAAEVRELKDNPEDPDQDPDDPESEDAQLAKAVALSLAEETGEAPEILQLKAFNQIKQEQSTSKPFIKKEFEGASIKVESDEDDDEVEDAGEVVLLPGVSNIVSNRLGGRITIKKEIKEEEPDESFPGVSSPVFLKQPNVPYKLSGSDVLITKSADLKATTSSAGETSSSVTSSETSEALPVTEKEKSDQTIRISTTKTVAEEDDLFADVFKPKESSEAFLEIFEKPCNKAVDEVGVMSSDGSSGSDGDDFVAVMSASENSDDQDKEIVQDTSKLSNGNGTEIFIDNSQAPPEDDLFSNIFKDKSDVAIIDEIVKPGNKKEQKPAAEGSQDSCVKRQAVVNHGPEISTIGEENNDDDDDDDEQIELLRDKVRKLDKPADIFTAIAQSAREKEVSGGVKDAKDDVMEEEGEESGEVIAKAMQESSHLWLKIASKYAGEAITKSPNKAAKRTSSDDKTPPNKRQKGSANSSGGVSTPTGSNQAAVAGNSGTQESPENELMREQRRLIKEMKETEMHERLNRFTNLSYQDDKASTVNKSGGAADRPIDQELDRLGIKPISAANYRASVLAAEGLEQDQDRTKNAGGRAALGNRTPEETDGGSDKARESQQAGAEAVQPDDVIYSASAPGFTRSTRDGSNVVDVSEHRAVVVDRQRQGEDPDVDPDDPDQLTALEEKELYAIQAELARENASLVAEMNKADRIAGSVTDQMYQECQELLQLFGVPWIVSPTEAEAQCAYLDAEGLTHGTITDDSDIWLFGGKRVYKNFFNQEKYVELFSSEEVSHHFGLDREKLILVGMLTGSDYTLGVEGVGPVTALEILAEFEGDGLERLKAFKEWWARFHSEFGQDYGMQPVGNKVREKLRKLKLANTFPSEAVMEAYVHPRIDESLEKFSWSIPNLVAVRDFARERFGWDKVQVDEILKPVIRSLQKKSWQGRIDNYFTAYRVNLPDKGLQSSKRVEEALRKVKGLPSPQKSAPPPPPKRVQRNKPTTRPRRKKKETATEDAIETNGTAGESDSTAVNSNISTTVNTSDSAAAASSSSATAAESSAAGSSSAAAAMIAASSSGSVTTAAATDSTPDVSLIAKSCGFVVVPSTDDIALMRKQAREQKNREARARAAQIFKKSQEAKEKKLKKKFKRPARLQLDQHNLSSDEEN